MPDVADDIGLRARRRNKFGSKTLRQESSKQAEYDK
jgi:hypothetical protein